VLVQETSLQVSSSPSSVIWTDYVQSIKQVISDSLWLLLEQLDILEYLRIDRYFLLESHRVFTQEIEFDDIGWLEGNVFELQRTTTIGIGFIFSLFVSGSKSQTIDKV
jgi:hypothetical protein